MVTYLELWLAMAVAFGIGLGARPFVRWVDDLVVPAPITFYDKGRRGVPLTGVEVRKRLYGK